MTPGESYFPLPKASEYRVDPDPVQAIVEHGKTAVRHMHTALESHLSPEMFKHRRRIGQSQDGTVDRQQPMPVPEFHWLGFIAVKRPDHNRLVEFDKGRVSQIGPGLGPCARCHRVCFATQDREELPEMELDRLERLLQDEQHHHIKSQMPPPRKDLVVDPVSHHKTRLPNQSAHSSYHHCRRRDTFHPNAKSLFFHRVHPKYCRH